MLFLLTSCYCFYLCHHYVSFLLMFVLLSLRVIVAWVHVLWYLIFIICYLLTCFVYLNQQKIAKKRKYESCGVRCLKSYFGTNWLIFIVILSMLQFKLFDFYISMWLFQITIFMRDSGLLFYDLSKKRFHGHLARSSIFPESQAKVDFKVTASR